jgi:hypothetical protein
MKTWEIKISNPLDLKIYYFLYSTFFTAFTTSVLLGNHSANKAGEYGAGVSAVFIFSTGASR